MRVKIWVRKFKSHLKNPSSLSPSIDSISPSALSLQKQQEEGGGMMNRRRLLTLLLPAFLFVLLFANFSHHLIRQSLLSDPPLPDPLTASLIHRPRHQTSHQLALRETKYLLPSLAVTESVLFPDWDVFLLLPSNLTPGDRTNLSCLFSDGATSAANYTGRVPSSARHGFLCKMPRRVQRLRPFYAPRLVGPGLDPAVIGSVRSAKMVRWTRLAYESFSTIDDVIVFAKGVNRYQGKDRPARDVSCVFSVNGAIAAVTPATSSAQEVFRCPHPQLRAAGGGEDVRVTVRIAGEDSPFPSLAAYRHPLTPPRAQDSAEKTKSLMCACTMVYNAAKFLREWVAYHAAVGVERFVLYDNGSDDDLAAALAALAVEGYDVSSVYWPWQKTQEAGFSHCAASQRDACTWMAFIDVDEFLYSPSWALSASPNRSMMVRSVIGSGRERVGQVQVTCLDFAPSGQRAHPRAGVTQGYTCRLRGDAPRRRHKSVVMLEAVGPSLRNWVHHFEVGPGWGVKKAGAKEAVVNHYKYQAWSEFRVKFRRRVSAYVADWKERRNEGSKDRARGLGFTEVEPAWWAQGRCEVRDTGLRDAVRRWFAGPTGKLAWEF